MFQNLHDFGDKGARTHLCDHCGQPFYSFYSIPLREDSFLGWDHCLVGSEGAQATESKGVGGHLQSYFSKWFFNV